MKLKTLNFNAVRGEKGQNIALIDTDKGREGPVITVSAPGPKAMTKAALRKLLEDGIKALED